MQTLYIDTILPVQTVYNFVQVKQHTINATETVEPFDIIKAIGFPEQPNVQLEVKKIGRSRREGSLIRFLVNAGKITPLTETQNPERQRSSKLATKS
jgi:hypothetical protein